MVTLEGAWDCTQCGKKGIPGRLTRCPEPACNDPRNPLLDPEERPYLPTDAKVVTDDEGLRLAELGPTWNCGKCGTLNLGDTTVCSNEFCKQPLSHDDDVAGVHTYVSGVDAVGVSIVDAGQLDDDRTDMVLQGADKLQQLEDGPLRAPSRTLRADDLPRRGIADKVRAVDYTAPIRLGLSFPKSTVAIVVGFAATLALVLGGGTWFYGAFIKTTTVDLSVTNMTWERQIEVEEYRTLTREDWDHPGDARVISRRQKIHHYDQVKTGTRIEEYTVSHQVPSGTDTVQVACGTTTVDNGNGFFEQETKYCDQEVTTYETVHEVKQREVDVFKDVPVYKTWYVYEIDRWVTDRFDIASGESSPTGVEPHWPLSTADGSKERTGDERHEDYEVELVDTEGRSFNESLDYGRWSLLSEGQTVTGEQTRRGKLRSVNWPAE